MARLMSSTKTPVRYGQWAPSPPPGGRPQPTAAGVGVGPGVGVGVAAGAGAPAVSTGGSVAVIERDMRWQPTSATVTAKTRLEAFRRPMAPPTLDVPECNGFLDGINSNMRLRRRFS